MSLILQIDTTGITTSVSLALNGKCVGTIEERMPNSHAQKITLLIQQLLLKHHYELKDLSAIAISKGPGSYTGLRIGSSTVKALCFALSIPLIAIDTLMAMQFEKWSSEKMPTFDYFCPMLDAKRMEVYMALYDINGNMILPTQAKIMDENFFLPYIESKIIFFGNGATKLKPFYEKYSNAYFDLDFETSSAHLSALAIEAYQENRFENIVDFEPFYLKEFYSPTKITIA